MAESFADTSNTIIEEREELIISPIGDSKPILRTAHFLKPIIASIDEPDLLPRSVSLPLPPTNEPRKRSLKVEFGAWRHRLQEWNKWVLQMHSIHHSAWEKAGICEAILSSTYEISRYNNLIFGLAEYWCPTTNSFIFPWGEATITLEDVMVLGHYPVLGSPVSSCSVQKVELKRIEVKLMDFQRVVGKKARKVGQYGWMRSFTQCGTEIEHEAFLSLWLSRFVLQNSAQTIRKQIFPIAINLARGIPVALAPAVLASIYRDLSRMKARIISAKFSIGEDVYNESTLHISAPFQLVQLWAWERFQAFQPKPNMINPGDPRFSRWNKVRYSKVDNVVLALASAGENFIWRPYAKFLPNWAFPRFYNEKEEWISTDLRLRSDLESFACCLKVSKLVGMGFTENYFPHRVAMQFGIDQDIPGHVDQSDENSEVAWTNFSGPITDAKFYIPSRFFLSGVTLRYLNWWNQLVSRKQNTNEFSVQRFSIQKKKSMDFVDEDNTAAMGKLSPCGKRKGYSDATFSYDNKLRTQFQSSSPSEHIELQTALQILKTDLRALKKNKKNRVPDVPPGFQPKSQTVKMENSHVGDEQTGKEMLPVGQRAFDNIGKLNGQSQSSSSSLTHDNTATEMHSTPKSVENILHREVASLSSQRDLEETNGSKEVKLVLTGNEREDGGDTPEIPGLALEARIRSLETEVTKLKAARFCDRLLNLKQMQLRNQQIHYSSPLSAVMP
ncbi:uncharacterized protein LOC110610351 [Manihot esculenta]|uniref:uncharacterized protein LOC110610351 n=1 Tax=Manihot esculenta TaxID=3983 RepID=UPI001CC76216|nr:uncharacterized protein LOC110610351 [Manihot esculenta]